MRYAIVIEHGPTTYGAYVPDLPGCVAAVDTREEVVKLIHEAIDVHLEGMRNEKLEIPNHHRARSTSRLPSRSLFVRVFGRCIKPRISILRALKFLIATVAFSAQTFGVENPDAQPPLEPCCPIVELRQYTLHPGKRDVLIDLFDREFVESQEALGMKVIGQFRDLDDPDRFVWLRGFRDMASRAKALQDFYGGPIL